jgi:uncharacterized membrane protein YeaQ/YmgE (transglycosylase-associated protein family)
MELLFAILGGIALGLLVRSLVRGRETHGVLVVPGTGAIAAAIVWSALTWLGWPFDGGWIWVATFVVAAAASAVVAVLLPRARRTRDAELFERLLRA